MEEFKKPHPVKKSKDLQRLLLEKLEADSQAWFSRLKKSLEEAEVSSESGVETDSVSESECGGVKLLTLPDSVGSSGYSSLVSSDAEDEGPFKRSKDDRLSHSLLADYPGSLLEQTRAEVAKMSLTLTSHELDAAKNFESYRVVENVMKSPLVKRPASPESPLHDRYNTLSSLQDDDEDDFGLNGVNSTVDDFGLNGLDGQVNSTINRSLNSSKLNELFPPLSSSFQIDPRQNHSFSDFSRPIGYRPHAFGPFERSFREPILSHSFTLPSTRTPQKDQMKEKVPLNPVYSKTILCKYYLKGYCVHGDSCSFAHGEHELKLTDRDKINNKHDKFKTEPCRNLYEEQFCQFGPKCIFAHVVEDLLNREIFALKPCKHFHSSKLGLCHLGKNCFYAH